MLPLVFLGLALGCALISRILLLMAAVRISIWWALGVILPFGPLVFRLNYPEEARRSMMFRLMTVPCFGAYILLGPGLLLSHSKSQPAKSNPSATRLVHYGMERPAPSAAKTAATPAPAPTPTMDERRVVNATEFERLREWNKALKLRKRDLLHSDVEGNRDYVVDLALYNDALAKASAEKDALAAPAK